MSPLADLIPGSRRAGSPARTDGLPADSTPTPLLLASARLGRRRPRARALRHRLRSARPRAPARALGRGDRLRAVVGGRDDASLRGGVGGLERRGRRRDRARGREARWRRSSSPACAGRRCCAPRTPSWPRRSRSWRRAGGRSSSTATATTCAPRCADFEAKLRRHRPKAAVLVHIGGHVAFEVREIAELCAAEGVFLIEDCAHAHGAAVARPAPGDVGRRRRLLLLRDEDRLDRRGRRTGLRSRRRARLRARLSQLRQARPPGRGPELPHERVHGRAGTRADRADGGDRRRQERRRARAAGSRASGPPRAARRDGLRPVQVHRLRPDRALDREGLRRAVPPHHGHGRRPAQQRLGRRAPLVRAALLPPRP